MIRIIDATLREGSQAAIELVESVRRNFVAGSLYQRGVARRNDDAVIGTRGIGLSTEASACISTFRWRKVMMLHGTTYIPRRFWPL